MLDSCMKSSEYEVWEHCTPSKDDLQPYKEYQCTVDACNTVLYNRSHYEMHMLKKHRLPIPKITRAFKYHCPQEDCHYHPSNQQDKYFMNLKYLKQHYQKVHLAKAHVCEECKKSFITPSKLTLHREKSCGRTFSCHVCHWKYDSYESLRVHMKRKKHTPSLSCDLNSTKATNNNQTPAKCAIKRIITHTTSTSKKRKAPREMKPLSPKNCNANKDIAVNGTKPNSTVIEMSDQLANFHSLLRTIQTQTDTICMKNCTLNSENNYIDRVLTQFCNMHTQTCDKLLSQLAPTDMQTQTNWSSLNENSNDDNTNNKRNNAVIRDELLVSTETQTSFTECLRNSTYPMDSSNSQMNNGNTENSMSLYHTQYTQTCESDIFLQGLGFSSTSEDLMEGFQSAYTQT